MLLQLMHGLPSGTSGLKLRGRAFLRRMRGWEVDVRSLLFERSQACFCGAVIRIKPKSRLEFAARFHGLAFVCESQSEAEPGLQEIRLQPGGFGELFERSLLIPLSH